MQYVRCNVLIGLRVRPAGQTSWMDQLDGPAEQTTWTDQLDGPAGWTSWTDQLDGPDGRTRWTDQLDRPAGRTSSFYLKPWPVRIFEDCPFSLYIVATSESDECLVCCRSRLWSDNQGIQLSSVDGTFVLLIYLLIQRFNFWTVDLTFNLLI